MNWILKNKYKAWKIKSSYNKNLNDKLEFLFIKWKLNTILVKIWKYNLILNYINLLLSPNLMINLRWGEGYL